MKKVPKQLWVVADWLRENHPTPYPVVIRFSHKIAAARDDPPRLRQTGYFADTERRGRLIVIRIALRRHYEVSTMVDTLIHEWAHAVTWRHEAMERRRPEGFSCHDEEWGVAYARIYRAYADEGGVELCQA